MANIWEKGQLKEIFYDLGVFAEAQGTRRMILAPFELIDINGEIFFQPVDSPIGGTGNGVGLTGTDTLDEAFFLARGEFFYTGERMVLSLGQMGDYAGHPSDWTGLHQLGQI